MGISQATFSSDGQAVYVGFVDGNVAILDTLKFQIRCRINLSTYVPTTPRYVFLLFKVTISRHA